MRKSIKALSMTCLSSLLISCQTINIPSHETVMYSYSSTHNVCIEFNFIISNDRVGRVGESRVVDIEKCDNITGLKNINEDKNDWPALRTWLENVFEIVRDSNGNAKLPIVDLEFDNEEYY